MAHRRTVGVPGNPPSGLWISGPGGGIARVYTRGLFRGKRKTPLTDQLSPTRPTGSFVLTDDRVAKPCNYATVALFGHPPRRRTPREVLAGRRRGRFFAPSRRLAGITASASPRSISPPCSIDQGGPYASVTSYPLGWKNGALAPRVSFFGHVSEYRTNLAHGGISVNAFCFADA